MQREAQLAVTARLNDPRSAARTVAVELSGAFSASGKDMDAAYIEALRRGLAVLCGPAGADVATIVRQAAHATFPDDRFWREVAVELPISLPSQEWTLFCTHTDAEIVQACAKYGVAALAASDADTGAALASRARDVIGRPDLAPHLQAALYLQRFEKDLALNYWVYPGNDALDSWGYGSNTPWPNRTVYHELAAFNRLAQLGYGLVALKAATVDLSAFAATPGPLDPRLAYERFMAGLKRMLRALEPAAVASVTFTAVGEKTMPWPLVTFAASIAELAGRRVPPGFVPVASVNGVDDPIPLLG